MVRRDQLMQSGRARGVFLLRYIRQQRNVHVRATKGPPSDVAILIK